MKKIAFFLFLFASHLVFASTLKISPTRIDLSSQQPIAIFEITNGDKEDALVESKVMHWAQERGEDNYIPTKDILMVPPAFKLKPNEKQIVRFALRTKPKSKEMSYRVFLTNLSQKPTITQHNGQSLQMKLRIGIPIFVEPESVKNAPDWTWKLINKKQMQLTLNNNGNMHIFIDEIQLFDDGKSLSVPLKTFKYVLPGQKNTWEITLQSTPTKKQISVLTDDNGNKSKHNAWIFS